ncbi:hypothetical protein [Mesorhizobium sp. M0029]|uniref:hypothetical protein n=1 Tax=Mesorhizobium sp. M0029 TaxID=2956850 RepID=UPI00333CA1B3
MVLGAPLAACRRIDVEPLSLTDFRSDGHRWMLRSSGVPVAAKAARSQTRRRPDIGRRAAPELSGVMFRRSAGCDPKFPEKPQMAQIHAVKDG